MWIPKTKDKYERHVQLVELQDTERRRESGSSTLIQLTFPLVGFQIQKTPVHRQSQKKTSARFFSFSLLTFSLFHTLRMSDESSNEPPSSMMETTQLRDSFTNVSFLNICLSFFRTVSYYNCTLTMALSFIASCVHNIEMTTNPGIGFPCKEEIFYSSRQKILLHKHAWSRRSSS